MWMRSLRNFGGIEKSLTNMGLANPIFLYAFGGLLIPLAIHLWSRNTRKKIFFGSLQFIAETDTKTVKNFLPSELLLLLLRMLALVCLIMIFCAPFISQKPAQATAYLIDQSLEKSKSKIEKALPEQASIYTLELRGGPNSHGSKDFWTALMRYSQYDSLVIFSPGYLSDFKGNRPESLPNIHWISTTPETQHTSKSILLKNGNKNLLVSVNSTNNLINYQRTATESAGESLEIRIFFQTDPEFKEYEGHLRSALLAIEQTSPVSFLMIDYAEDLIHAEDWLIRLSASSPPITRRNLIYTQEQGELLRLESKDIYALDKDATIHDFISEHLPLKLENVLSKGLDESLGFEDRRQMSKSQIFGNADQLVMNSVQSKKSITHWFLIGFMLLLLTERTFSAIQYRK
jgi:hypothetical protein